MCIHAITVTSGGTLGEISIQQKIRFETMDGTFRCTDPTQATARFVIVASQHTHNYALKVKRKYITVYILKNTRLSKRGGGKLKAEESYFV